VVNAVSLAVLNLSENSEEGWSKPPNTADSAATLGAIYPFSANDELGKLALIV
jgi:hypothetical protein